MRTSLNEIEKIEKYLEAKLGTEEFLLFEAGILLDPEMRTNVLLQRQAYSLIHQYHIKQLKAEVETVHKRIFSNPLRSAFCHSIYQLFKQ